MLLSLQKTLVNELFSYIVAAHELDHDKNLVL
jgi:hypothetical protein